MITEIGIVAGDIWHFLDEHGEVMLSALVKGIDRPRDNILMSLGYSLLASKPSDAFIFV